MRRKLFNFKTLCILALTIAIWLVVVTVHGYLHVSRLSGQCCGYEGDPGFLTIFFIIYPGIFYALGLFVILGLELLFLKSYWKPE